MSRQNRSVELIADFSNGYAEGWFFYVGWYFRGPLDIKYTPLMEPALNENGEKIYYQRKDKKTRALKYKKDGSPYMQLKTKEVWKWTQGPYYSFAEGHIIYDTAREDPNWQFMVEVKHAIPVSTDKTEQVSSGHVAFKLYQKGKSDNYLEPLGFYHMTQTKFVNYLKTGDLK